MYFHWALPTSSCSRSNGIFGCFRRHLRPVPMILYPPKVSSERPQNTIGTGARNVRYAPKVTFLLRKVRDSNPRYPKGVYRISSPARSITLPTFRLSENKRERALILSSERKVNWKLNFPFRFAAAKVVTFSEISKRYLGFFEKNDYLCTRIRKRTYLLY